uniref:Uncharacterized protein n=1 Tax=Rhizophora mucronata TaxID=61149 RepID=A0A2P2J551_RHIMU
MMMPSGSATRETSASAIKLKK